jgi:hypothetical protein
MPRLPALEEEGAKVALREISRMHAEKNQWEDILAKMASSEDVSNAADDVQEPPPKKQRRLVANGVKADPNVKWLGYNQITTSSSSID